MHSHTLCRTTLSTTWQPYIPQTPRVVTHSKVMQKETVVRRSIIIAKVRLPLLQHRITWLQKVMALAAHFLLCGDREAGSKKIPLIILIYYAISLNWAPTSLIRVYSRSFWSTFCDPHAGILATVWTIHLTSYV